MAGWDNWWETNVTVKIVGLTPGKLGRIDPNDYVEVPVYGVTVFDTPSYYALMFVLRPNQHPKLAPIWQQMGGDKHPWEGPVLWERSGNLSDQEVNQGRTVRDMDNLDVSDALHGDEALSEIASKSYRIVHSRTKGPTVVPIERTPGEFAQTIEPR